MRQKSHISRYLIVLLTVSAFINMTAIAATYYSRVTGIWSSTNTWSITHGGGSAGFIPTSSDIVVIEGGFTVTVDIGNAVCDSLILGGTSTNTTGTLTFAASGNPLLTVLGGVQVGSTFNAACSGTITFTSGSSLTCNSLAMGNATVTSTSTITMTNGGTLTINGALTAPGTGTRNWTPGTPLNGGTVVFGATNTLPNVATFNNFNYLTISAGTTSLSRALTTVSGVITVNAGATLALGTRAIGGTTPPTGVTVYCGATTGSTISGTGVLTLGGDVSVTSAGSGTNGATISCPIALTNLSTRTFNVADDGTTATDLTISGVISTSGNLVKSGTGQMVLSGANTYTGTTTVSQGTLIAGRAAPSGAAGAFGNAASAITLGDANTSNNAVALLTGGAFTVARTVTVSNNANSGGYSIGGNTANASIFSGAITMNQPLTISQVVSGTVTIQTGGITNGANLLTVKGAGNISISAVIGAGNGGIMKSGTGTLTLSGTNTYTGTTTLSQGTLIAGRAAPSGAAGAFGNAASTITLGDANTNNNAVALLTGGAFTVGRTVTVSNNANSGGYSIGGNTANASGISGLITFSQPLSITQITGATLTISGGITGGIAGTNTITFNNVGTVTVSTVAISNGTGTTAIVKQNTGTTNFNFANTYTGSTTVNGGTLQAGVITNAFGSNSAVIMGNYTGAILNITGFSNTIGSLTGGGSTGGNVTLGTATLTVGSDNTSPAAYAGVIGAATAGNIIKTGTGTLILSGTSTYTGTTTVSQGTLVAGAAVAVSTAGPFGNAASTITLGDANTNNNAVALLTGGAFTVARTVTVSNNANSGGYSIGGNTDNNSTFSGLITFSQPLSITQVATTGTNTLTISGGITGGLAGTNTVSFNNIGAVTQSTTAISNGTGTTAVLKKNTGATTLSFANTYTGTTTVSQGTLIAGAAAPSSAAGAFGNAASAITLGDANTSNNVVALLTGGAFTVGRTITISNNANSGGYSVGGNTNNNSTFSGLITFSQPLSITQVATTGTNTLTISGGITGGLAGTNTITFNNVGTVTVSTAAISNGTGTTNITKQNSGTLTMNFANTYTGGTTLNAGTLNINNANALGTAAGTFTIAGGTIDNTSGADITTLNYPLAFNADFIYSGTIPRNLNLGAGAVSLSSDRQITVSAGTFTIGGTISAGTLNLTKADAGILAFGSQTITLNTITISAGSLTSTSGTMNLAGNFSNSGTFTHNSGTVTFNGTGAQTINSGGSSFNNFTITNTGGICSASTNGITVLGTFTTNVSTTLDMGTNALSVSTVAHSGILKTQNTSTTPITSGKTWGGTVQYNAGAGGQTIVSGTYSLLNSGGTSGTNTLSGNITVSGTLTIASSTTFSFGTTARTVTLTGTGSNTLVNNNIIDMSGGPNAAHVLQIAASSIATFGTLTTGTGSTVEYTVLGGGQTVNPVTYNHLKLDNTSGTNTAGGNLTVNGTLTTTSNGTLDMSTYTLTGTLGTVTNGGTIKTSCTTNPPLASGINWGSSGIVEYAVITGGQYIPAGTFNNLQLDNTNGTNTANGILTVNAKLTITAGGTLEMAGYSTSSFGSSSDNAGTIRWSGSNVYVKGAGTTEFYSSSGGSVATGTNYGNLLFTGTNKTIGTAITATGNMTVSSGASVTVSGVTIQINGDVDNAGAITNNGTITVGN